MHIFYSPCFFGSTLNYLCVYIENTFLDAAVLGRAHSRAEGAHLRGQRHLAEHTRRPHVQRQDGARDRDAPVQGGRVLHCAARRDEQARS